MEVTNNDIQTLLFCFTKKLFKYKSLPYNVQDIGKAYP